MKEFLLAAMPWVVLGLALAVVATFIFKKKRNVHAEEAPENEQGEAVKGDKAGKEESVSGLSMGLCLGSALGVLFMSMIGTNALVYGIAMGMLIGVLYDNSRKG